MARIRVPISNFQFGEVSPSLVSRTDTPIYNNSAKKVENFFLRNEGGLLKRFGTEKIYEYDTAVEATTCTITVSDYANIATGSTLVLFTGSNKITLEFEASSGESPSSPSGNTHFVRANESNNTTADNIFTALNAVTGFTVANPSAAVVTVTRDTPVNPTENLTVTSSDTTRLTVTDFTGGTKQQVRVVPFIFSDDERYIVSLENAKIRVFQISPTTGAISLVQTLTADTSSAAIPFSDLIVSELTYAQAGDVMFIAHQTFMTRKLVRTSLTTFQLETLTFDESPDGFKVHQPFYSFQPVGMTLDPSADNGNGITLTTSAAYFDITGSQSGGNYADSKHIGVTLRYHENEIIITSVQSATQATGNVTDKLEVKLATDAIETTDGSANIRITFPLHGLAVNDSIVISEAGGVGGIAANQINGTEAVQEVIDENVIVVTAGANANASTIGGGSPKIKTHATTTEWGEQSYSTLRGFPAAVTLHENRLWLAGSVAQPDGIWASKPASYFDFDVGDAEDGDAIDLTAAIGEINTIRHLTSNRDLQIFTTTSEMYIPSFTEKAITPTNAQIRRQTPFGSNFVRPESFDGATIYVQKTGSVVREYIFSDSEAAYVATGISVLSPHLINSPVQMCILRGAINRPESYAFVLNLDGTIAVFTSNRAEQRAGWSQWTTNGRFDSVCTVDDRVFCVGRFDLGAGTEKFILMEFNSAMNMDFSDKFVGTAGVFDVSSHFANGAKVKVVNDTDYLGEFTVASGNVDVSAIQEITNAEIGYDFNVEAQTLPIDAQIAGGPLTGEPRSVNRVVVDLLDTLSVSINDKNLVIRQVTDDFSLSRTPVTGKEEFRLLGYSKDPVVTIKQTAPLSLQVNGIIAEVSF